MKSNPNVSLIILCAFSVVKYGVSSNIVSNISLSSLDKDPGLPERGFVFNPSIPFSFHRFNQSYAVEILISSSSADSLIDLLL